MDKPGMSPQMGMEMMKKMMGGGDSESGGPMQMCKDMTSSIKKTASMAAFSTPELHALFSEWLQSKEKDVLDTVAKPGRHDLAGIAKALKLTQQSTAYLLARMAAEETLTLEVKSTGPASKPAMKKKVKRPVKAMAKKKVATKKTAASKRATRKAGK